MMTPEALRDIGPVLGVVPVDADERGFPIMAVALAGIPFGLIGMCQDEDDVSPHWHAAGEPLGLKFETPEEAVSWLLAR